MFFIYPLVLIQLKLLKLENKVSNMDYSITIYILRLHLELDILEQARVKYLLSAHPSLFKTNKIWNGTTQYKLNIKSYLESLL